MKKSDLDALRAQIAATLPPRKEEPLVGHTRISTIVSLVRKDCLVLADIGTDHAQIPIMACKQGLCARAIAVDIAPGPLSRAVENIYASDVKGRIETRLGDGLKPLTVGEADTVVISGMGGAKICDIITRGLKQALSAKRLVLQPQHDLIMLRKFLHQNGFDITDERLCREDDRFYIILAATPAIAGAHTEAWTEKEYCLGKLIPGEADWKAYLENEQRVLAGYIQDGATGEKKDSYAQRLVWIKEILG